MEKQLLLGEDETDRPKTFMQKMKAAVSPALLKMAIYTICYVLFGVVNSIYLKKVMNNLNNYPFFLKYVLLSFSSFGVHCGDEVRPLTCSSFLPFTVRSLTMVIFQFLEQWYYMSSSSLNSSLKINVSSLGGSSSLWYTLFFKMLKVLLFSLTSYIYIHTR